jgi:glycosyltransferase involved in cell wall biosynthesis
MRILWVSNDPRMKTGYGTQTAQVTSRMVKDGHDVAVLAMAGIAGRIEEWEGLTIFPQGYEAYSNDIVEATSLFWRADLTVVLFDPWALDTNAYEPLNAAVWCPIDHATVQPRTQRFFQKTGATPIAMSQYGRAALGKAGFANVPYVPHGIELAAFHPYDQREARTRVGLPQDRFIVGMVSTNKGVEPARKAFDVAFRTFATFCKVCPDALLYVHASFLKGALSLDLRVMATHYDIPAENIIFADQFAYRIGYSDEAMANLYSAFDVLSFATMGEGFGIPALEAQACGCPVITSDFTVQRELNPDGWRIAGNLYWDEHQKADFFRPDDRAMLDALADCYERRPRADRTFALGYDADTIYDTHWRPTLADLEIPTEPITS